MITRRETGWIKNESTDKVDVNESISLQLCNTTRTSFTLSTTVRKLTTMTLILVLFLLKKSYDIRKAMKGNCLGETRTKTLEQE